MNAPRRAVEATVGPDTASLAAGSTVAMLRADFDDHAGRLPALPVAGAAVWCVIGVAGLMLPPATASLLPHHRQCGPWIAVSVGPSNSHGWRSRSGPALHHPRTRLGKPAKVFIEDRDRENPGNRENPGIRALPVTTVLAGRHDDIQADHDTIGGSPSTRPAPNA